MTKSLAYAVIAVLLSIGAARAQTSNKIAAESLFDRGLQLMQEGKFAEACVQLEQSQATESGIGTMLYLAECYERLGRTASAWVLFREASSAARAEGQMERSLVGAQRAAALEPNLARLTVQLAAGVSTEGLQILRDGADVPSGLWGVPTPVDPGEHTIEARAPGKVSATLRVAVEARGTAVIEVPALVDAPAPASAASMPAPTPIAVTTATSASDRDEPSSSLQPVIGIVVGAVGVVALGVGGAFGADALSKKSDSDDRCGSGPTCSDRRGVELNDAAQDSATVSNVLMIGGAVLVAAGVVLYLTAPSEESARVSMQADATSARLSLTGAF